MAKRWRGSDKPVPDDVKSWDCRHPKNLRKLFCGCLPDCDEFIPKEEARIKAQFEAFFEPTILVASFLKEQPRKVGPIAELLMQLVPRPPAKYSDTEIKQVQIKRIVLLQLPTAIVWLHESTGRRNEIPGFLYLIMRWLENMFTSEVFPERPFPVPGVPCYAKEPMLQHMFDINRTLFENWRQKRPGEKLPTQFGCVNLLEDRYKDTVGAVMHQILGVVRHENYPIG